MWCDKKIMAWVQNSVEKCQLRHTNLRTASCMQEMRPAYISRYRRLQAATEVIAKPLDENQYRRMHVRGCSAGGDWKGENKLDKIGRNANKALRVDELDDIPHSQGPVAAMSSQLLPNSPGDCVTNPPTHGSTVDEFPGLLNDCCMYRYPFQSGIFGGNRNHREWAMWDRSFLHLSGRRNAHSYWHRTISRLR